MTRVNINSKSGERGAFCRHWFDPTCSAISPRSPATGLWEIDESVKKMCSKKNYETKGNSFCSHFEKKSV